MVFYALKLVQMKKVQGVLILKDGVRMHPIIDFKAMQKMKFKTLALKIQHNPEAYLDFDHVADFYQAVWLQSFPQGTTWYATGLDDGAQEFYAKIIYEDYVLSLSCGTTHSASFGILNSVF